MIVLVCRCGKQIRAPGAVPGRVGRCPDCGSRLVVPCEPEAPLAPRSDRPAAVATSPGAAALGSSYHLNPTIDRARPGSDASPEPPGDPKRLGFQKRKHAGPMMEGLLPPLKAPETSVFASLLYPLRGAHCMGLMAGMAVFFWILTVVYYEYSRLITGEAGKLGASLIGTLFAILAAVPGVILGPPALAYWLQYLGRVLVSSAMGETLPPRAPDRSAQGLLQGLAPWMVWLVMGVGVGVLPAFWVGPRPDWTATERVLTIAALALFATAYAAPALMLAFLHDEPLAATPLSVVVAWYKLGGQIPRICLIVAGLTAAAAAPIAVALWLRQHYIWIYLGFALVCTLVVLWAVVVLMRVLGLCYFHKARTLKWHDEHPRWGTAWRL